MRNKSNLTLLIILITLVFASCAGSRGGTGRKGYGCPSTASISQPVNVTHQI